MLFILFFFLYQNFCHFVLCSLQDNGSALVGQGLQCAYLGDGVEWPWTVQPLLVKLTRSKWMQGITFWSQLGKSCQKEANFNNQPTLALHSGFSVRICFHNFSRFDMAASFHFSRMLLNARKPDLFYYLTHSWRKINPFLFQRH